MFTAQLWVPVHSLTPALAPIWFNQTQKISKTSTACHWTLRYVNGNSCHGLYGKSWNSVGSQRKSMIIRAMCNYTLGVFEKLAHVFYIWRLNIISSLLHCLLVHHQISCPSFTSSSEYPISQNLTQSNTVSSLSSWIW